MKQHFSSFENQPQESTHSHDAFSLEETNAIQIELMEAAGGNPIEWIQMYTAAFRELIEEEPELHDLYIRDHSACIAYIQENLKKRVLH